MREKQQLPKSTIEPERLGLSEAASQLGRKGGQNRSAVKVEASRQNGKKGGRPAKKKLSEDKPI